AVEQYRRVNPAWEGHFYGVQLPYHVQADAADAQAAMDFIAPDRDITLQIGSATDALSDAFKDALGEHTSDYNLGNVKARMRMVAQYAVAGHHNALVVGSRSEERRVGKECRRRGSADLYSRQARDSDRVRE